MRITPKTSDTGLYVPVYRNEPPKHPPSDEPILDKESTFNFWLVVMLAIAAVGSLGFMWGWFKTPSQALTDRNQKLEQQLTQKSAELDRITNCINQ